MRTTINLPDDLAAKLKRRAAERGSSVTALIEEALRHALAKRGPADVPAKVRLTTYGSRGLQPGIDLDDTASLLDIIEPPDATAGR